MTIHHSPEIIDNEGVDSFIIDRVCRILLVCGAGILAIDCIMLLQGSPPAERESFFRILPGSLLIFLLPGLFWGEVLGFRACHILELVAHSFLITLAIETIILPIPLLFHWRISLFLAILCLLCALGMILFFKKLRDRKKMEFITPLVTLLREPISSSISTILMLLIIFLLCRGSYRCGEDIFFIEGEKLYHLSFVRSYFSLPLALKNLGISPNSPPANFINLWEFLLAAWARLINSDPLPLYFRARFVIPLLGLSGMFLLIRSLFPDKRKSEILFWGVLCMTVGRCMLLSPSSIDYLKGEAFRGVMCFWGTAHHSDASMDILIAPVAALLFILLRSFSWRYSVLFTFILVATFLWHPREFFQTAIYGGTLGIALLLYPLRTRYSDLKKWAVPMIIIVLTALFLFTAMKILIPASSFYYDEFALKKTALAYAFLPEHMKALRNLFCFPTYFTLTSTISPREIKNSQVMLLLSREWQHIPFLILSALFIPFISIFGGREERQFSLFYILLWLIALCWNFSMLIMLALTYSELHICTPRIIYIFSYIVIGDGLYIAAQLMGKKGASTWIIPVIMFFFGFLVPISWRSTHLFIRFLSPVLCITTVISLILLFVPFMQRERTLLHPSFRTAIMVMCLFFLPILGAEYAKTIPDILLAKRAPIDWYGKKNPLDFSPELVAFLHGLSPGGTFITDPLGKSCIFIYAPQHTVVIPKIIGTMPRDVDSYREASQGLNPLFNPAVQAEEAPVLHEKTIRWISRQKAEYILVEDTYYAPLLSYFRSHPNCFRVIFDNPEGREAIISLQSEEIRREAEAH